MFSNPSVLPSFWPDLAASVLVLAVSVLAGRLLCTRQLHGDDPLERLAGMLVTGLLFTVGIGVTWVFRRPGVHAFVPLVLLAAALWSRRRPAPASTAPSSAIPAWVALGAVTLVSAFFHAWQFDWLGDDGLIHHGHGDLGYFGMLAKALPEARMSDGWTAVGGAALADAGMAQDQWYHWGPVWLGMLIQQVTGLPAIESVLNVGATVMCAILILVSAAVVRALTRWNVLWSTLVGGASIMTLAVPPLARPLLAKLLPFGWLQHGWDSLLFQFSYQFEALQVALILLCWLRGKNALALVLVFCATVGSPHFVGGMGVAVGTLMVFGVLRRDKTLWAPAAAAVGTILLAWGTLHWLLGVKMLTGLGSSGGGGLFGFTWQTLMEGGGRIVGDIGIGLLLGLLVVPGWLALIRIRRDSLPPQARVLGWLAFAALAGSMAAFHLFTHAEKFHFVVFPMAVLAQPIAVFGLALWASQLPGWRRALPILPLLISLAACVVDAQQRKGGRVNSGRTLEQVNALKQYLQGRPFGYIAKGDRPWWIPKRAFAAALLDCRCVRLNPLAEADVGNHYSRFYNSYRLMELTPYKEGTSIHEWSLRLAKSLGIRHILQTKFDIVPPAIAAACKPVFQSGDFLLYEIQQPPAVVSTAP
ncbi:MAG: hypothetical protein ACO1TE_16700 [Prosthecobacter sp.]